MKVQVGDWICFQQIGSPTYALVVYIIPDNGSLGDRIVTTSGETWATMVLEARQKQEGQNMMGSDDIRAPQNKRRKMHPEEVDLEVCGNCGQQMRPKGSRCIQCGHDGIQVGP